MLRRSRLCWIAALSAAACGSDEAAPPPDPGPGGGGSGGEGGAPGPEQGASLACPPGERPDGSDCVAPGVASCGEGFEPDGASGCEPILPSEPCSGGQTGRLGTTACAEVGSCGSGAWGDIPTDGSTVYVDADYQGTSTGSASAPYTTIQAAVDAAPAGGTIAIAAGTYDESIHVAKPLALWGRCPSLVHLQSTGFATVDFDGGPSELHGLSVTGDGTGIDVGGGVALTIEDVLVHDLGTHGLSALDDATAAPDVAIHRSLFANVAGTSIFTAGATVTITDSEIRHAGAGSALSAYQSGLSSQRSDVTVERTVVRGSRQQGLWASGSDLTVRDSYVVDTQPGDDQRFGMAVYVTSESDGGARGSLTLEGSVVEDAHFAGVWLDQSSLSMKNSVVRDVVPEPSADQWGGHGVISSSYGDDTATQGSIEHSLVERVVRGGISLEGFEGTIRSVVVRDVEPDPIGEFGRGINLHDDEVSMVSPHVVIEGALVERVTELGIFVLGQSAELSHAHVRDMRSNQYGFGVGVAYQLDLDSFLPASGTVDQIVVEKTWGGGFGVAGADVTASHVIVRDVRPLEGTDRFGDGIAATGYLLYPEIFDTTLSIERATVENSARAGLAAFAAGIELGTSEVLCNPIALDAEPVLETDAAFDNLGDNRCGCTEDEVCKVISADLEPPTAGPAGG